MASQTRETIKSEDQQIVFYRARADAERYLADLGPDWRIVSRTTIDDRDSARGSKWTLRRKLPVFEWTVTFTYLKSGRSFDVIVTARDEQEALDVARDFVRTDKTEDWTRASRHNFRGWIASPARGIETSLDPGEAEWRIRSRRTPGTEEPII